MKFKEFVSDMPHGLFEPFRRKILATLGVSEQTFRNWQNGVYEPDDERKAIINGIAIEITGKPIY